MAKIHLPQQLTILARRGERGGYFGSYDGNVYALDAGTGVTLWSYATGNPAQSSPAVVNGAVYIDSGNSGNGNLYALNAITGTKLWSYATGDAAQSSPTVVNGVVYISSSFGDNLYALDASTGAELWSYDTGPTSTSPAVANGVVYVSAGILYALNASTGAKVWSYDTGIQNAGLSSPAVANGVVYFGSGFNVYALNASTGAKLWNYDTGGFVNSSPAVANGVVYIGGNGNLYALNASTGAKVWSIRSGVGLTSPAVANGVVYVSDDTNGTEYALNAGTGAKLWSYDTRSCANCSAALSSPAVVNGVVYVGSLKSDFNRGALACCFYAFSLGAGSADLFLRINPSTMTVHQGDLLTFAFPVWNLGPGNAVHEVLNTQVPEGTTLDYVRISGTPGLGTCTTPPYEGTGEIVCHENSAMAPNTTWTVRVVVKVTAPAGTVITESATTTEETFDPNLANNTATVSMTVQ